MRSSITIVLIAQFAAFGQQPTVPNVPKGTYKFEVNSQLVVVNVSAKDKKRCGAGRALVLRLHRHRRRQSAADQSLRVPAAGRSAHAVTRSSTHFHSRRQNCTGGDQDNRSSQSRGGEVQGSPPAGNVFRSGRHAGDRSDSCTAGSIEVRQIATHGIGPGGRDDLFRQSERATGLHARSRHPHQSHPRLDRLRHRDG